MSDKKQPGVGLNAAVAAELRAERVALGMTLDALAHASGIPKVSVQRYLKPTRIIDMDMLEALATALALQPEEVISRASRRLERIQDHPDASLLRELTSEERAEILDAEDAHNGSNSGRSGRRKSV